MTSTGTRSCPDYSLWASTKRCRPHTPAQRSVHVHFFLRAQRFARTFRAVRRRLHTPTSTCTWARRQSGTLGPLELNSKEWWCWVCRAGTTLLLAHRSESRNVGTVPAVSAALRAESRVVLGTTASPQGQAAKALVTLRANPLRPPGLPFERQRERG